MGSLPELLLPPLTPEIHRWKITKANPRLAQRRGVGFEVIVGSEQLNRKGQYDLYLTVTLRMVESSTSTPVSLATLKEKFELALLVARLEHPECGSSVRWDDQPSPIFEYESPENNEAAIAWAKGIVHALPTSSTAQQVWYDLEQERQKSAVSDRKAGKPVEIFLIARTPGKDAQIPQGASIDVLFHMNHLYWDGIGARIFVGYLLRQLNNYIGAAGGQEPPTVHWGSEMSNFHTAQLDAMKVQVQSLGTEFEARSHQYVNTLMQSLSCWGMPFKASDEAIPRAHTLTFTPAESTDIIRAVKTRLGPHYTISHLAQAATIVAMLDMYRHTAEILETDSFVAPTAVNARRYLRDDLKAGYMAGCVTGAVINVRNLKSLLVSLNDDQDVVVAALARATKDVKASFDLWIHDQSQLALGLRVHSFEGAMLSKNPMPFDKVSGPFISSDGINELYIPTDISSATTGETFMKTDKFVFLLNQFLPYMALRLDSWKGTSMLTICYNDGNFSQEETATYLRAVADFMLAFRL
ncbi:Tri3 [Stachybotrys chlorohalonatus IBT 40285]|uniref:Tri3 n=1 Tax=Stachybotrys chlorohalonatus (strain IBT 40285) TaxID=1283841 RepID=A0A084QY43_STAC4|nr:Tri3 [Stachybotrys chlorohalonata IBT 40285]